MKMPTEIKTQKAPDTNDTLVTKQSGKLDESVKDIDLPVLEDIRDQIKYIEKAVNTKESHFMSRVIRNLLRIRKKLTCQILLRLVQGYYPTAGTQKSYFLELLPEAMDTDSQMSPFKPKSSKSPVLLPEVEVYLHLLLLIFLIDTKYYKKAISCSELLLKRISDYNRRSMDMLAARCYFYHARVFELENRLDEICPMLHARLTTCTLRKDQDGQTTLVNLLLRNYIHHQLYDQASKLVSRIKFPDHATNNELARYLYYLGCIKAIQMEYTEAHEHLVSALRKAPQHNVSAVGFKQAAHKLNTVVGLLLGESPDRSNFRNPVLKNSLAPYLRLTQAVRAGDLKQFNEVIQQYQDKFITDKTFTLIVRLRHNVIKTGVRRISLSYSRISLDQVAAKLQLGSPVDAEFIVAKAIKDRVIDAVIDHEKGCMVTHESQDLYSTGEPLKQFHSRIRFCMDIRNQSVKAMRYPPKHYNKQLETAEERREREQQELENANNISEDDFDF